MLQTGSFRQIYYGPKVGGTALPMPEGGRTGRFMGGIGRKPPPGGCNIGGRGGNGRGLIAGGGGANQRHAPPLLASQ